MFLPPLFSRLQGEISLVAPDGHLHSSYIIKQNPSYCKTYFKKRHFLFRFFQKNSRSDRKHLSNSPKSILISSLLQRIY